MKQYLNQISDGERERVISVYAALVPPVAGAVVNVGLWRAVGGSSAWPWQLCGARARSLSLTH